MVVAIVLVVLVRGFAGGCTSTILPPRLTRTQHALIDSVRFPATVAVEPYKWPVYSERLITALRATQLFARVDSLSRFSEPPTFVARVARPIYGSAVLPLLTGISLGLIPTITQEEHGHAFWLISSAQPRDSLLIDFSYRGPSVLGWVCVLLNVSPNLTSGNVYTHARFYQALAYTIAAQGPEIESASGAPP